MDDVGASKDDIKLPDGDLGKEIQDKYDKGEDIMVTILKAMGEETAVGTKTMTGK